ncbi:MAG: PAS domain S-box protein [Geobacteraceae bacterium]|nr:PAS domain S-box protein [Geobacteraceae bacterium]
MPMNNKSVWSSLKVRVTVFSLIIFLAGIWSLAFMTSTMLREDLQQMLSEQQLSTVSIIAWDINQEIEFRLNSLEMIAKEISQATLHNSRELQATMEEQPLLEELFNGGFFVVNASGRAIADVPRTTGRLGMDVSGKSWMIGALQGKTTIGKPVIGKMLQVPVFTIATPIRDTDKRVIGVLAGVVDLSRSNFLNEITNNRYGRTGGYLLVAPQHGLFITGTDRSRIMQPVPAPGVNRLFDQYAHGFEGSGITTDTRGGEVLSSSKQIPAAGWFVIASIPTHEAFAPIHAMQKRTLLAAIILTILAGALTWLILRRLLSPMLDAVRDMSLISESDLPVTSLPIARQDEVGQLIGAFNRLLEILALRESRLIESDEHHRSVLKTAMDGIWFTDTEGRLQEVNEAYCRMSGYSEQELLGMKISDIEVNKNADDTADHIREIMALGEDRFESRHRRKDGSIFDVEVSVQYRAAKGGQLITFIRNITDLKQAETEKATLSSQLHQAQKMESVGSLAGGVAHDFNNKLSVILGCTYMASIESDPVQLKSHLEEIRKAAEQSSGLTRQLLAFARKQTIMPKVLDLNETVENMLKMLQRLIGENIRLTWRPSPELWQLMLDPTQIDQILANLCVNARDAIAEGGRITIETGNCSIDETYHAHNTDALPGEYVRLAVSDNGCGMEHELLDRIFEPFFTTKEKDKGTGLGLATVFGIVKQNNGFINVYSEPGLGTTFTIYLPRHADKSLPTVIKASISSPPTGQETVLLVEDEHAILNMASTILSKQGYSVIQANTPTEAIRLADGHDGNIGLVITDVIMPEMNGKDLVNRLMSRNPRLKCLYMSGYTADVISRHGVLDEGVNFIQKPFSLPALAGKVRQVLDSESNSA